jgi:molecular chaperone GrpE
MRQMTVTNDNEPRSAEILEAQDDGGEAGLAARLAALEAENAELKDRALRALAEVENNRRRAEREANDARTYAISRFAADTVAVADNLRRAIEAVPAEAREGADAGLKTLLDGVELTEREFLKALEKHGVRRIDPTGERFDPNLHQAMFEVEDKSQPAGTVLQVVQPGFTIGERVLRPAMVAVAKGGPKPPRRGD